MSLSSIIPSLCFAFFCFLVLKLYAVILRKRNVHNRKMVLGDLRFRSKVVGFFHPYCNAGGGGERVLWMAIASLQQTRPDVISIVYSGDVDATKEQILEKVKTRFNILLNSETLQFVFLHSRKYVEDSTWPRFTLLGQSLGSMILVWEALTKLIPDLYIDTMGYAFTFPVVSLLGSIPIGAYVHYPTISTNMLDRVRTRQHGHTNSNKISSSFILSAGKLFYYRIFMYYYASFLRLPSFLMVNSSWTKNHIDSILTHTDDFLKGLVLIPPFFFFHIFMSIYLPSNRKKTTAHIAYPPCPTEEMSQLPLAGRERIILSIAQFRPEKDHQTQLRAFSEFLKRYPRYRREGGVGVRLVLIGGSRNEDDATRVDQLRTLAKELDIEAETTFIVNASYQVILAWLKKSSIGLSTMIDEHFGINIVEFMAAGVIPVTHASGGPQKDIVVPYGGGPTGYHATSVETFAEAFNTVFSLTSEEDLAIRTRARNAAVDKFSEQQFVQSWERALGEKGWDEWL